MAIARRKAWLCNLDQRQLARRVFIRVLTDAVLHLSSRGPLELGLALHHLHGYPVLPATSLKGLAAAVRQHEGLADGLYGQQESAGRVAILDGLPLECRVALDAMTPHFGRWYQGKGLPDDIFRRA